MLILPPHLRVIGHLLFIPVGVRDQAPGPPEFIPLAQALSQGVKLRAAWQGSCVVGKGLAYID